MSVVELLLDLRRLGIRLEADGERLRYTPRDALTPDLLARLKEHKADILASLRPEPAVNRSVTFIPTSKPQAQPRITPPVRIKTTVETKWRSNVSGYYTYPAGTEGWLCDNLDDIPDEHIRYLIRDALRAKAKAGKPHYAVWLCGAARILPIGDVLVMG